MDANVKLQNAQPPAPRPGQAFGVPAGPRGVPAVGPPETQNGDRGGGRCLGSADTAGRGLLLFFRKQNQIKIRVSQERSGPVSVHCFAHACEISEEWLLLVED